MKRLVRNTVLFLLPVLVGLYFLPVGERRIFEGLVNDCENRGTWIHDRLSEPPDHAVDIAFIGSSHTINGIDDRLISDSLGLKSVNLGYCRLGRNLQYILLKKLLKAHRPKLVVVEIDRNENTAGHPVFPLIAGSDDIIFADAWLNRGYFSDSWLHFSYKLEILQDELYRADTTTLRTDEFGHSVSPQPADTAFLKVIRQKRQAEGNGQMIDRYVRSTFAMDYISRMAQLCRKKGVKLTFIYLPGYGTKLDKTGLRKRYDAFGTILFPPSELLDNQSSWHDEDHLNRQGAEKLSEWLIGELRISLED